MSGFGKFLFRLSIISIVVSILWFIVGDEDDIPSATLLFVLGLIFLGVCYWDYCKNKELEEFKKRDPKGYERQQKAERDAYRKTIERERLEAEASQASDVPWTQRYYTYPCPHCGHYKVRYATFDDKAFSYAFWGVWSPKRGEHYKCDNCKRMW